MKKVAGYFSDNCFMCRWILEDINLHGKLNGGPKDHSGASQFPVYGQERHLAIERATLDNRGISVV